MGGKLPRLFVITGPTASGKTAAAIQLAKKIKGAIISADSRQVYTGMNIGTAKPIIDEPAGRTGAVDSEPHPIEVPDNIDGIEHYLINIRRPNKELSLAEWQAAAYQAIEAVIDKGMTPILAGGTMLYINSIVHSYEIPSLESNPRLREELAMKNVEELYSRLIELDAKAADFVPPRHARRIIRALEVIEATGVPFSRMRKKGHCRYNVEFYGLFAGWDKLAANIEVRAREMVEMGLMAEKQRLIVQYGADLPLLNTINYRQVPDHDEMVRSNLKYARRQMSWWRGHREIKWHKTAEELMKSDEDKLEI